MSTRNMPDEERHHLQWLRELHSREQKGLCYYCKVKMTPTHVDPNADTCITIDHKNQASRGGGSNFLNTCASCRKCNMERHDKFIQGEKAIPRIRVTPKPPPPTVQVATGLSFKERTKLAERRRLEAKVDDQSRRIMNNLVFNREELEEIMNTFGVSNRSIHFSIRSKIKHAISKGEEGE